MTGTVLARLVAGAAMALGLLPVPARAACELKQLASVDMEINPNGGVLVPMQINGHDVWMALNMSTGMPMIGAAALAPLGLKTGAVQDQQLHVNGLKVTQQVIADSLRIGNADFTGWTLYLQPGPPRPLNGYKGRPVVGALSSIFMNVVDLELDIAARRMNLFKQSYCRGGQVYWSGEVTTVKLYRDQGGLLFFPMEMDGKDVETSFNTAERRSWIDERVTQDFFGFRIGSPGVSSETVPGPNGPRTIGVRPMSLSAKGLGVTGLPVSIVGDRAPRCIPTRHGESGAIGFQGCYSIVPLELGTDVLAQLRFYVAAKEGRVYFTLAKPAAASGAAPNAAGQGAPAAGGGAAAVPPAAAAPAAGAAAAPAGDAPSAR